MISQYLKSKGFSQSFPRVSFFKKEIEENISCLNINTMSHIKRHTVLEDRELSNGSVFCISVNYIDLMKGVSIKKNFISPSTAIEYINQISK